MVDAHLAGPAQVAVQGLEFDVEQNVSKPQERELMRQSNRAGGLMVDRYKLLAQDAAESGWILCSLRLELSDWLASRRKWMMSR